MGSPNFTFPEKLCYSCLSPRKYTCTGLGVSNGQRNCNTSNLTCDSEIPDAIVISPVSVHWHDDVSVGLAAVRPCSLSRYIEILWIASLAPARVYPGTFESATVFENFEHREPGLAAVALLRTRLAQLKSKPLHALTV